MSILIVGGLLALAVVAIVGAVLLGLSEERIEQQRKAESAALSMQTSQPLQLSDTTLSITTPPSTMSGTLTSVDLRTTRPLAPSLHEDRHSPVYNSNQLPVHSEEEYIVLLNGQIHAITSELRSLAHNASELEQRLSMLSEVLESQHLQSVETTKIPVRMIEKSAF